MDLREIAKEINESISKRKDNIGLSYNPDKYFFIMKGTDGLKRANYPSVSKIVRKFHPEFDEMGVALKVTNGDSNAAKLLIEDWKKEGKKSQNIGKRTHFLIEENLIKRYDNYKKVIKPRFFCNAEEEALSNQKYDAGLKYLDLMEERGAVLLDTELPLGDPEDGYVGLLDNAWIIETKDKDGFGIFITDWKTNKPKNFTTNQFTKKMYEPFERYDDYPLTHYFIQNGFLARLVLKMLQESKFKDVKYLGGIVVLLKDDGTFQEYRAPKDLLDLIFNLDLNKFL